MTYLIKTINKRISVVFKPDAFDDSWKNEEYKDMIPMELPDDFDFEHIGRYSIDESNNLIDNGLEDPSKDEQPKEPTNEDLLLETAGDHEYRLCLLELGVTEDDLQTL